MNKRCKSHASVFLIALATLTASASTQAATSISTRLHEFTPVASSWSATIAKPNAWYNLSMGYKGWTHDSVWGYFKVSPKQVGKKFNISVNATQIPGVHPGVSVWFTPQGAGLAGVKYAYAHFYNQWDDIVESNVKVGAGESEDAGKLLGTFKQYFITNGYDRDEMIFDLNDPDAINYYGKYDQSLVNRVLDGEAGVVAVGFIPLKAGTYKFAVGGINPDAGVSCPSTGCPVAIDVTFPE